MGYARGIDAVGGAAAGRAGPPRTPAGRASALSAIRRGGMWCSSFRTRHSGNPLVGCALPPSFGNLTHLEHVLLERRDTEPDARPDTGEFGNLARLRCMYFSHTGIEGELPRSLEKLVNLEVFLREQPVGPPSTSPDYQS